VSAWIREQEELAPDGRRRPQDHVLSLDFPEQDNFALGWVGAMLPEMMRNFHAMFSRSRGNPATCVLRHTKRRAESDSAPDQDNRVAGRPVRPISSSGWVISLYVTFPRLTDVAIAKETAAR
jgi:hypothetical protein